MVIITFSFPITKAVRKMKENKFSLQILEKAIINS